jgi:iron complex outermembrane recepter protein
VPRSLAVLPWLAWPVLAGAADPDPLEEVVVTARRFAEPVLAVPLSMHVLGRPALERSSVDGLQSLAARAPGLSFESTWGGGNALPTVRGQFAPSLGDTVGVFVDGVYQASRNALDVDLLDIERIEVVYGPQGALYGNSTFSGAIGYVSRAASDVLASGMTLDAGNGDYYGAQGWISGPLGGEWQARVAAGGRRFGGLADNSADGRNGQQSRPAMARGADGTLPGKWLRTSARIVRRWFRLRLRQPGQRVGSLELLLRQAARPVLPRHHAWLT